MTDLKVVLTKLQHNLNTLREREATYGGSAPLELLNQITDHQEAIALTEQTLRSELRYPMECWAMGPNYRRPFN